MMSEKKIFAETPRPHPGPEAHERDLAAVRLLRLPRGRRALPAAGDAARG